jgi:UPF0716 protein FxsA
VILVPFPFFLAEIFIFFGAVNWLGFWNSLLLYFAPCLLGLFIVSIWGRAALMSVQMSLAQGQVPAGKILHAGAIFLSGLCFLVPSFFLRLLGICLLLPGLRHLLLWKFKGQIARKLSQGGASFSFNGFRFGGGFAGPSPFGDTPENFPTEREVQSADVLDVQPLKISHETKRTDDD